MELLHSPTPTWVYSLFPCQQLLDKFNSFFFDFTVLPCVCVVWCNVSWYKQSTKTWHFSIPCASYFLESSIFLNACGPLVKWLQRCLQSFLTVLWNISWLLLDSWKLVVDTELSVPTWLEFSMLIALCIKWTLMKRIFFLFI